LAKRNEDIAKLKEEIKKDRDVIAEMEELDIQLKLDKALLSEE
jgi:hypothetical protein